METANLPLEDFPNFGNQKHLMDKGQFGFLAQLMSEHSSAEINKAIMECENNLKQMVADISTRSNVCPIKATLSIETKPTKRVRVIWRNNKQNFNQDELIQVIKNLDAFKRDWYIQTLLAVRKLEATLRILWNVSEKINKTQIELKKEFKELMR